MPVSRMLVFVQLLAGALAISVSVQGSDQLSSNLLVGTFMLCTGPVICLWLGNTLGAQFKVKPTIQHPTLPGMKLKAVPVKDSAANSARHRQAPKSDRTDSVGVAAIAEVARGMFNLIGIFLAVIVVPSLLMPTLPTLDKSGQSIVVVAMGALILLSAHVCNRIFPRQSANSGED